MNNDKHNSTPDIDNIQTQDTIDSLEEEILNFLDSHPEVISAVLAYIEGTEDTEDSELSLNDYQQAPSLHEQERDAKRREIVNLALTTHKRLIYSAILNQVKNSFVQDYSTDKDDLFSEVLGLAWDLADEFEKEGKAKLSTRLYQLARKHAYFRLKKARNRHRLVTENIDKIREGGAATFSDDELASIRASELDEEK